jgi:hypothetical protein
MPNIASHLCLQKAVKVSLRRCVYRRWEAQINGTVLTTKTKELERMYRGNTPYPIGKARSTSKKYANGVKAGTALKLMVSRRKALGYRTV